MVWFGLVVLVCSGFGLLCALFRSVFCLFGGVVLACLCLCFLWLDFLFMSLFVCLILFGVFCFVLFQFSFSRGWEREEVA